MTTVGVVAGLSVDHLVVEGEGARFSMPGGPGLYGALGARLVAGTDVRLACAIPRDDTRCLEWFVRLGIDVSHCSSGSHVPELWILNSTQGRKVVPVETIDDVELIDGVPSSELAPVTLTAALVQGLDGLMLSAPERMPQEVVLPRALGVDPHQLSTLHRGIDYLRQFARPGTVLLPSRVQLRHFDANPRAAARSLARDLELTVIARLDAEGMYVATAVGSWNVRDQRAVVVETTGAGDASAGAVTAAVAAGCDPLDAARFGVSVARTAIAGWGAEALVEANPLTHPYSDILVEMERQ